jgi:FkbM family methyltransferase
MSQPERGYFDALLWLWRAGVRYGGIIDLGCADGNFSVFLAESGPARGSVILNVDAQSDYRDSLATIQAALGGHFRICAVGEHNGGSIEMQRGEHPYWSSVRPLDDRYWTSINGLSTGKPMLVPLRSLDSIVEETALPGPYLLKLDVQGAEASILAGGRNVLASTDAVMIEIQVEDFAAIHQALAQNDFVLFDLCHLIFSSAGTLAWFYAIYVKSRIAGVRAAAYWDVAQNREVIALQRVHRETAQNEIWAALDRHRAGEWPPLPA